MLDGIKTRIQNRKNIRLIRKSRFFDELFYTTNNPKVFGDPCAHYYHYGWLEGYDPSVDFNGNKYLSNYLDVADTKMNPLLHYLKYGEKENRRIEKSSGVMSIEDVCKRLYHRSISYNLFYCEDKKRVNVFIDEIDKYTEELLRIVTKYCKKFPYSLRIICDNLHELNVDDDVEVINYNSSNYLEVSLDDRYICSSWKYVSALLNTNAFYGNVFYYLREIDDLFHTSFVCCDDRVTCLVTDPNILKPIQKIYYQFEWNKIPLKIEEENYLYCDFGDSFIEGIEWINQLFLQSILDMDQWKVFILSDQDFVFHFDCGLCVQSTKSIPVKVSLMIQLNSQEENYPCISFQKISEEHSSHYINIKNNLLFQELNKENVVKAKKDESFLQLVEKIKEESHV